MIRIHLVRHGKAAAGWGAHADPGLDETGRAQAEAVAERLAPLGPLELLTSPLARTRETAAPLSRRWGAEPRVEPRVAEIPSPTEDLEDRAAWLREAMAGTWGDLDPALQRWRDAVVDCIAGLERDTVIFSHFVAINAVVGRLRNDDRMVVFRPDYTSVTTVVRDGDTLRLEALGAEADTVVR
jgi:broad specificity phosphatase PhoE